MAAGLAVIMLLGRALQLQAIEGGEFQRLAQRNRERSTVLVPARGLILDANGDVLAQNGPSFALMMTPANVPEDKGEREALFARAAELAGVQPTDLDLLMSEHGDEPAESVVVRKGISHEPAMRLAVEVAGLPGFSLDVSPVRRYEDSVSSLSHVLGYVGNISQEEYPDWSALGYRRVDEIGKTGIERSAERYLRGRPGRVEVEVDARGHELSIISREEPVRGANVRLSLDLGLQRVAESSLASSMELSESTRGSVVAIDPRNGGVKALVSLPAYDPNAFAEGIDQETYQRLLEDPDKPLFPRAVSGEFPAGSTFKPFVAYAALQEDVIDERTTFMSGGGIQVGPWFFPDWRPGGHGVTDVRKAISDSVNTFFYIVGGGYESFTGLGVSRIREYARRFGFGEPTGIDLPTETAGFIPSKEWKQEAKRERWYVGDTYNLSIGQGDFLASPLQLATATAMIASGGTRIRPHLIDAVEGGTDVPVPMRDPAKIEALDAAAMRVVREGMRRTVTLGSARSLANMPVEIAGKTGTAQAPGTEKTHAWFSSFAPYDDPELVVIVLVEEGGEGSDAAVPVARDIYQWWAENRR